MIPGRRQLWWRPCLKRAPDSTREHCWFLAPTDYPSFRCWSCRGIEAPVWREANINVHGPATAIADRHYSRQTPGSERCIAPGRGLLLESDVSAAWGAVENDAPKKGGASLAMLALPQRGSDAVE